MSTVKIAFLEFVDSLIYSGYTKEAYEILGESTTISPHIEPDIQGRLTPDYSAPSKPKEKQQPSYKGKPGGVAPILELGRIIDDMKKDPTFRGLPDKLQKGILKIEKMTENAFKFASEKESFISGGDSLKILKKTLDKFGPSAKGLPENVIKSLSNLHQIIDTEIQRRGPEKGLLEKGKELGKEVTRGLTEEGKKLKQRVTEKGREFLDERKQRKERNIKIDERTRQNEQKFTEILKTKLLKHPSYSKIFYNLPPQIIKSLNNIGLGLDDLKKVEKSSYTVRTAHMIRNVMMRYLNDSNKIAMDFSGIGNLITRVEMNDREIARTIRLAIAAELDAVHLYELIVDNTKNKDVKEVLQDIADEEKVHASELNELLSHFDSDNNKFIEEGKKEVKDLIE